MPRSPIPVLAVLLLALPPRVSAQAAPIGIPIGVPLVEPPGELIGVPLGEVVGDPLRFSGGVLLGDPAERPAPVDPEAARAEAELRSLFGVGGAGRFGLLSYVDVPVYQPVTPMPGTHVVGIRGHARPNPGESYEEWEWRVLRTEFGREAERVYRGLEMLDPFVAARILKLEARLAAEEIAARRRETWRTPMRQAYLFQQGRSRPGPLATSTLTSWHSQVDEHGHASGRAVDYEVPAAQMRRFHEIAWRVGLQSFGHDSNDPGHVFLPDRDDLRDAELARLRGLARVPEVTLATGLPVDRPLPPGGRPALRAAALEFASRPFLRHVEPSLARAPAPRPAPPAVLRVVRPVRVPV